MMWQRRFERTQSQRGQESLRVLRFAWSSYALSSAAAVLIAFLVWWGNRPDQPPRRVANFQQEPPSRPSDLHGFRQEVAGQMLLDSYDTMEEDFARMVVNQPVDSLLERLKMSAEMRKTD